MIHVLLSRAGSYRDIVDHLAAGGARITNLGPDASSTFSLHGKLSILLAMFSRKLWRARKLWSSADRLLVIGWQALPVLAMIRLGLLPRPHKILVMACFVHSPALRRVVDLAWRLLRIPQLGFITFSLGETRNLIDTVGMPASAVHFHLWRQELNGRVAPDQVRDGGFIFTGGFSNRDYDLLLDATRDLDTPLQVVASRRNHISALPGTHTTIHLDLPEEQFEKLLAQCRVVAMPLKSQGEACGQSVLLRVLRNGKPLVATRHEAIEAYLGTDYPGFVAHDDVAGMRDTLQRALQDDAFRATLCATIDRAKDRLDQRGTPGPEIEHLLNA